jgi:glycosyltransferase involved in cell wall biosynthesis
LVDIAFVRTNSIIYDIRPVKILGSLYKRYDLLILGWDRKGIYKFDHLKREMNWRPDDINTDVKILRIRAPFSKESLVSYVPMVFYFPLFWMWVLVNLIKSKPRIVYACDLDTVLPCYFYKLLFGKKLIFDVFDRYAMTLIPAKFKTLHAVVNHIEEFFSARVDVLINISKEVLDTFRKKPKRSIIVMNCAKDCDIKKEELDVHHPLKVVYTGAIWRKSRGLENIIAAVKDLTDVEFVIAGWYRDKDKEFLDQILEIPNVKFRGLLEPNDALALEASSDVMIALYEPKLLLYTVTLPNKLFEAMMCGVPLITNVASEVVNEFGSGIIVEYNDVEQIKEAIVKLRDDSGLRRRLGLNARKAFLEKYSWSKMEEELFKICDILLKE